MAATVEISESNGAAETVTDGISNNNFGGTDLVNLVPATHPVVQQVSSNAYSFTKWWRVHLVALGGSASIGNLKVWKDSGAYKTGEQIGSNTTVINPTANSANCLLYGHKTQGQGGGVISPMPYNLNGVGFVGGGGWNGVPMFTSQPSTLNLAIANSDSAVLSAAGYSNYSIWALQIAQAGTTPLGAVNQKTFIWQYDES